MMTTFTQNGVWSILTDAYFLPGIHAMSLLIPFQIVRSGVGIKLIPTTHFHTSTVPSKEPPLMVGLNTSAT
eukprot:13859321-Ditylum_brightwellii.AAC.1